MAEAVRKEQSCTLKYMLGTTIEVPRTAVVADAIAAEAKFFSFGANDFAQISCGFSRANADKFLGEYVQKGIYEYDPFQSNNYETALRITPSTSLGAPMSSSRGSLQFEGASTANVTEFRGCSHLRGTLCCV